MSSSDSKLVVLEFKPGVNNQATALTAEGTWFDSDKIRFRDGRPENWRGWNKKSSNTVDGSPRSSTTWQDQLGNAYAAFGTECGLWAFYGGLNYDLTPVRGTAVLANAFHTVSSNSEVLVSATNHGVLAGDRIVFTSVSGTIGGNVYVSGSWTVASVANSNSFYFTYSTIAAATSASAGAATANYLINCGTSSTQPGYGWGIGTWSHAAGWGVGVSTSSITLPMRLWPVDNWGQDLVAAYRDGPLYYWQSNAYMTTRASLVPTGPSRIRNLLVSPNDRHLIALGCTDIVTSVFDPLLVQWCSQDAISTWTPTPTNTAGSNRLQGGYKIVNGRRSRNQILVWTDSALFGMSFVGPPFVFAFRPLGDNCGLIGPNAQVDIDGVTYWMSTHTFYKYDGRVTELRSTVAKYVFDRLTQTQYDKILVGSNKEFSEVIFLYPSVDSNEIDSYVLYDINDDAWSIGAIDFTMWNDRGAFENITTGDSTGYLYNHDVEGLYTGDGAALNAYIKSGDFDIAEGDEIMFSDRFIPDFDMDSGSAVGITFYTKKYPNGNVITKGPYQIGVGTQKINPRLRGRSIALMLATASAVPESRWQYGKGRLNLQPDGKR